MASNPQRFFLLQVNSNSVTNKRDELENLLRKFGPDVAIAINDTRLQGRREPRINGFKWVRRDHPSGTRVAGGVAFLVPSSLKYRTINNTENLKETLIIELDLDGGRKIRIGTVYLHPGEKIKRDHFLKLEENSRGIDLLALMGDFNARVGLLENECTDQKGEKILTLAEEFNYELVNEAEPTYISSSHGALSAIDLTLIRKRSNISHSWYIGPTIGSDHLPTVLELGGGRRDTRRKRIHWAKLREGLGQLNYEEIHNDKHSIDSAIKSMEGKIRVEIDKNTRWRKVDKFSGIKLSDKTSNLISIRRKLLNLRIKEEKEGNETNEIRKALNQANKQMKIELKKDRDSHDTIRAKNILTESDLGRRWKLFREFEGGTSKVAHSGGIENRAGELVTEEEDLVELHAERLEETHSFPNNALFDEDWKEEVEAEVEAWETELEPTIGVPSASTPELETITQEEVIDALKNKNNKSAAGIDGINYKILKHGGPALMLFLASLFNLLFSTGYFPDSWKEASIKMLPKEGKDKTKVNSYRPISLTSCVSKLYETIIKTRLEKKLSRIMKDNIEQAGYKKKRGSQEHLVHLTEQIHYAFKTRKCVAAAFLDVRGAFDRVWAGGLIFKLNKAGLARNLLRTVHGFMTGRRLRVVSGPHTSRYIHMKAGTPQGAVLSPCLFNFFVSDLRERLGAGVQLVQFADDIALWATSNDPREAEKALQIGLDEIAKWTLKWRVELCPDKTQSILFTRCPSHHTRELKVSIYGKEIKEKQEIRFLGVLLDNRLNLLKYRAELINRVKHKCSIIKKLAAKSRWSNSNEMAKFYKTLVPPTWFYGSVLFAQKEGSFWDPFKKIEGETIRSMTGLPPNCSYSLACDNISIKEAESLLKEGAKKRLRNILINSPFGHKILDLQNVVSETNEFYKSPVGGLLEPREREELREEICRRMEAELEEWREEEREEAATQRLSLD